MGRRASGALPRPFRVCGCMVPPLARGAQAAPTTPTTPTLDTTPTGTGLHLTWTATCSRSALTSKRNSTKVLPSRGTHRLAGNPHRRRHDSSISSGGLRRCDELLTVRETNEDPFPNLPASARLAGSSTVSDTFLPMGTPEPCATTARRECQPCSISRVR